MKQTVIAVLYDGCVSYDVALAAELLSRKFEVQNATENGAALSPVSGLPLSITQSFSKIDLSQCRALLVPGGEPATASPELVALLRKAKAAGVFIMAIGESVKFLKQAGMSVPDLEAHSELYAVEDAVVVAQAGGSIDAAVELGARLDVLDAKFVTRTKDHYRGILGRKIRALALALIQDSQGRYLLHQMYDAKRKQTFYRPVGGGVDFHEPARIAIIREIREELGYEIVVDDLVKTFENIFVIEDMKGHEMVSVFRARFKDAAAYEKPELAISESGRSVSKAVWKTAVDVKAEGAALYPIGLEQLIATL